MIAPTSSRVDARLIPAGVCPLCEQTVVSPEFCKDRAFQFRCGACDILFTPASTDKDVKRIYAEDYYRWISDNLAPSVKMKLLTFERWLAAVERFAKAGTLLDVGCSFGFLLQAARRRGWKAYGIEKSDFARKKAREQLGPGVVFKDLREARDQKLRFNVIAFFDVIEHFYEMSSVFAHLDALLASKGILVLSTPNHQSLFARLMGRYWFHIKPMEHPVLFSERSLKALLARHGFEVMVLRRAVKRMTLTYVAAQFKNYRFPLASLVTPAINRLPPRLREIPFPVYSGEMFVIARKR